MIELERERPPVAAGPTAPLRLAHAAAMERLYAAVAAAQRLDWSGALGEEQREEIVSLSEKLCEALSLSPALREKAASGSPVMRAVAAAYALSGQAPWAHEMSGGTDAAPCETFVSIESRTNDNSIQIVRSA
jgi:hypothetical protein